MRPGGAQDKELEGMKTDKDGKPLKRNKWGLYPTDPLPKWVWWAIALLVVMFIFRINFMK